MRPDAAGSFPHETGGGAQALRAIAAAWHLDRRPAIVIDVVDTRGSVPRERGTRMLVLADAAVGTIGGGHLELQAIATARSMLALGATEPRTLHYPLGPSLGQCCGGAVTIRCAPLDTAALAAWPLTPPRFHLQLYGAGHVGRAIVRALAPLPVSVDWIDERDTEFPPAGPPHVRTVCVDAVEAEVAHAPPGAFYLVLTHRHDLDLKIAEAILRRGDFGFFGLIGSRTKKQRFLRRFEERGLSRATVARMTCPIGMPGIDGKEPEVIAAAVVAQLLWASSSGRPPAGAEGHKAAIGSNAADVA